MKTQKRLSWPLVILLFFPAADTLEVCKLAATAQSKTHKPEQTLKLENKQIAKQNRQEHEEEHVEENEKIDYSERIFEEYWEDLAYFKEAKENDPFAPYNKFMATLAFVLDVIFCRGLAELYMKTFPQVVRISVANFIQNTCELRTTVNDMLQTKHKQAVKSITRFLINTIFGCCGLFDVAKKAKIKFHSNDFGTTLGSWGVACGPFIMKPTGPSNFRDFLAGFIDSFIDPFRITYLYKTLKRSWPFYVLLKMAHKRSETLKYSTQAKNAKNPYELMKIAHLQTREYKVAQKRFEVLQKKNKKNDS